MEQYSATLLTQTHAPNSLKRIDFIELQWDVPDRGQEKSLIQDFGRAESESRIHLVLGEPR